MSARWKPVDSCRVRHLHEVPYRWAMANEEHLAKLRPNIGYPWQKGADSLGVTEEQGIVLNQNIQAWNSWRQANPEIEPDLAGADLSGAVLWGAYLMNANLSGAILTNAALEGASLRDSNLQTANLAGAHLTEVSLINTDLRGAILRDADLSGARLINTNLEGADLRGCHVFGTAAWQVRLDGTLQSDLVVTKEPRLTVDNLDMAQFVFLLVQRRGLRDVITTMGERAVLILGRFTEQKEVLNRISERLRSLNYLPIVFDFERPPDRDFSETVKLLAGLSRFILADITNPMSVPMELQATVPELMVPFVTILRRGS